ncbi:unnamed protein product [Rhizophagus irregularis]|uniref:Uncharacterized protein n=1 Tax=Rhizophagus irregularis TaxID=588596 RepID=A0A2I1GGQ9_9GLOM|nr:hypothetical protein RhiirA4_420138 [Rhizophagus irregularis]CAB4431171.1 unnamed protein product [Rhizophagus irregularis]
MRVQRENNQVAVIYFINDQDNRIRILQGIIVRNTTNNTNAIKGINALAYSTTDNEDSGSNGENGGSNGEDGGRDGENGGRDGKDSGSDGENSDSDDEDSVIDDESNESEDWGQLI